MERNLRVVYIQYSEDEKGLVITDSDIDIGYLCGIENVIG
jgi:hypothetical protein